MTPHRRRNIVVGATSAAISSPAVLLAAIGYSNRIGRFFCFVVGALILVGVLAAAWFDVVTRFTKRTRWGLVVAGSISAILTCLTFVALYSLLTSHEGQGSWISRFLGYAVVSFSAFSPHIFLGGMLVGWIAGIKWLSPYLERTSRSR